jgi:hypothetical protein
MNRGEILNQAAEYTTKDREQQYGTPEDNFKLIADFWNTYISHKCKKGNYSLTAEDVANLMALLKIARITSGQKKEDNYIDLAGYAACGGEIATKMRDCGRIE